MSEIETTLRSLETRVTNIETVVAVDAERHRQVVGRLDRIDAHINKLMWLLIGSILAAFLNFALKGGLTGVI